MDITNATSQDVQADDPTYADLGLLERPVQTENPSEPAKADNSQENQKVEVDKIATPVEKVEVKQEEVKTPEVEEKKDDEVKQEEAIPKLRYDELRSWSSRTINKLTDEVKKLKEASKTLPAPEQLEKLKEAETKYNNVYQDNVKLVQALEKMQKHIKEEFDIEIDPNEFLKKEVKPVTLEDFERILEEREARKAQPVQQEEKKEDPINEHILDFMNRNGLIGSNGRANELGDKFIDELDKVNLPSEVGVELFETLLDVKKLITPQQSKTNEGKQAIAKVMSTIIAPTGNQGTPSKGDGPLSDLLEEVRNWG